jgi:oligoendopeptidase F
MLNHTDTFKALETLAHEMGHAIHATRSATNTPLYDGHSIVTAETASTLFENLVFDALLDAADPTTRHILLHDKITRDIATVERQIAFFNCELEIHETIHRQGAMTHAELKAVMYRHLQSYLGKAVHLDPIDGASYVYIPHLRYGFYVYSYTFGHLMSSVIAARFKEDASYRKEIDIFLTAGSSDTVNNIFKRIGIMTSKPETFHEALGRHARDIREFERFVKSQ